MRYRLAIHHLDSGETETVLETERLIEAPNWHPDGDALIVNSEGRLYRVALAEPALAEIDTGFARACNNDHGISPDGRHIVISDSTRTEGSCIYILPSIGGPPRRVTQATPSYWHGWSPDGDTLAFTGKRDGVFDIFTIPAVGGDERRLTEGFEHTDGPDYTPDGQWIWFNGQRDGVMDLWRIRPDGSDLERMTDDDRANWFPHPSPDGAYVLYLAYAAGVEGHPRAQDVELRLMPCEGGEARCLRRLHGGQGTINVPCWAPAARRFAFVELTNPPWRQP